MDSFHSVEVHILEKQFVENVYILNKIDRYLIVVSNGDMPL